MKKEVANIDLLKFHLIQDRLYTIFSRELSKKKSFKIIPVPKENITIKENSGSNTPQIVIK